MAQNYFSIVTNIGRNKLALSAAGGAAVTITHFAIGDGNGAEVNPTAASTSLVREVWRTPVESVMIDPLNPSAVLVTSISYSHNMADGFPDSFASGGFRLRH